MGLRGYLQERLRRLARTAVHVQRYWINPLFPFAGAKSSLGLYKWYLTDWFRYRALPDAEPLYLVDSYPCLFDHVGTTPYDPHYFYQAVWAMQHIARSDAKRHVDIGSDVRFVGMLTTHVPAIFIDLRPLIANVPGLSSVAGSVVNLPFASSSVESLSCLHVAEHVGLGRYGDPLDPSGTRRTCVELGRVLAPNGNLFFSVPVGQPRVCFNAHRIHDPKQIVEYFNGLELVEFSAVDDRGKFVAKADLDAMGRTVYGCGLFWFQRNR